MFRIIRVPPALDTFFQPLRGHFHWDHFTYFRLLVVTIAFMWGRRNVEPLSVFGSSIPSHPLQQLLWLMCSYRAKYGTIGS